MPRIHRNTESKTTLRDVAAQAGVSYQTVSRVLNGSGPVAEDTRQRVQQVIDALNYRPSKFAQVLGSRSSRTLAMITYGSWYSEIAAVIECALRAARVQDYDVLMSEVTNAATQDFVEALDAVTRWQPDGVILFAPLQCARYDVLSAASPGLPVVLIHNDQHASASPGVVLDHVQAVAQLARHVLALGHTAICEIRGPDGWHASSERHEGLLQALGEAGLAPLRSVAGDWTAEGGYRGARMLLAGGADFTAIVAADDNTAIGAIRALAEAGLRVPEDVSVVGFDDIALAAYTCPPLTTARQDFAAIGEMAVRYLLERIQHPEAPPARVLITPEIIIRGSTGPRR